jgi:hypothetical protein
MNESGEICTHEPEGEKLKFSAFDYSATLPNLEIILLDLLQHDIKSWPILQKGV